MNLYYIQANGDTFLRHIHDVEPTRWDDDNFCRVTKLTPEQIEHFGVHQLKLVTPPSFNPATQKRENGPALLIDGVWTQNWVISDLDPEASAASIAAQWDFIRAQRNALLVECDWTQLPNVPVDAAAWEVYRQALRDITMQDDPFNIVWPAKPE